MNKRRYLSSLLNESESVTSGDEEPETPINDDGTDVSSSDYQEVRIIVPACSR